ncbi:hypothetical protein OF83DRAFT_1048649 [Amylostereum chailletii]|nr:hypothetical protein OF83DRAFT_1048649 [Amylostereum chailletii]
MSGTSRLKRKLDEQGVNYSSGRATENFCLIGTPLPPLEKSKDTGEYVPLWKQDVRDEQGRRRLHGAFTGGFSAGYFNTVGSKEGWTPSTFISSRGDRSKKKDARPEDFMDEEDLAELRENQLMQGVKEQRDILGDTQAKLGARGDPEEDSMANSIARALMPPPEDSPGMLLLKKMGWRPGQGVGPRVTWRQRKMQDLLAEGKSLNDINLDALEDDEEAKKHMYPPRDTVVPIMPRKDNAHGVGYLPGAGLGDRRGQASTAPHGPKLSSGFGLGALNDADDDDVDVYDSSVRTERTYMPYDAMDADAEDKITLNSRHARESRPKPQPTVRSPSAPRQKFNDGTPVLEGFVLSKIPVKEDKWFPLPDVPPGWKPDPRRVWSQDKGKENVDSGKPNMVGIRRNHLTAADRGSILGETPLPSAPRSIFDYMTQKDRERIQNAAKSLHAPTPTPLPTAPSAPSESPSSLPFTPPNIAEAALRGFMPFPTDPVKQSRYIAYLRSQTTPEASDLAPQALPGQSADQLHKELADYAKSAAIFKPVSGAMASRFTSAAVVDNGPKVVEGLHQPVHRDEDEEVKRAEEKRKEEDKARAQREDEEAVVGSKAHAARSGMYGALTREVRPWQPSKLLCKRFGVKDPNPEIKTETPMPGVAGSAIDGRGAGSGGNAWQPEQALAEADLKTAMTATGSKDETPAAGGGTTRNLDSIGLGEDDEQGRDTLTYVRPSMDIFKAIFASDDEDSDDEEPPPPLPVVDVEVAKVEPGSSTSHVPAHLRADTDVNMAPYNPPTASQPSAKEGPVDITTFKPTFVPRGERETKKSKDKKDKNKERKKAKAVVSFAMEEDGEDGGLQIAPAKRHKEKDKDKERRKRRRKEEKEEVKGGDEEDMWIEKPPPEVVKMLVDEEHAVVTLTDSATEEEAGPARGRKRAVDFM